MSGILYSLGGSYFKNGRYKQSSKIDEQLLKIWPNHLDALWRFGFAKHKLNENNEALEIATKLKKLEPEGLFSYKSNCMHLKKKINFIKLLKLLSQPEKFLKPQIHRLLLF